MLLQLVVMFDSGVGAYMPPSFVMSTGGAIRQFQDQINTPSEHNILAKHPEDFVLYHVGTWDDVNCLFDLFDEKRVLAKGADLRK